MQERLSRRINSRLAGGTGRVHGVEIASSALDVRNGGWVRGNGASFLVDAGVVVRIALFDEWTEPLGVTTKDELLAVVGADGLRLAGSGRVELRFSHRLVSV